MQISLDSKSLTDALNGNKTYLTLAAGALVIVANHFGLLPPEYVPAGLDPNQWVMQLWALALGATGRSALKKLEGDIAPANADEAAKLAALAAKLKPLMTPVFEEIAAKRPAPVSDVARQAPIG